MARLERLFPGPGRLVEWTVALHDAGAAVWLERVSDADGAVLRQRQYLLLRDGRVTRQFAYTAPHRTGVAGAGGRPALDPALIGGLGDIAEHTVLASRGWSGNAIERVVLADGRVLIAKRIVPGADWIGRASADPGREGLLFTSGVLDRLPPASTTPWSPPRGTATPGGWSCATSPTSCSTTTASCRARRTGACWPR